MGPVRGPRTTVPKQSVHILQAYGQNLTLPSQPGVETMILLIRSQTRYPLRHWPCKGRVAQTDSRRVSRHEARAGLGDLHSFIYPKPQQERRANMARSIFAQPRFLGLTPTVQPCAKPAVTRIRTGVAAATTQSTNHYTITANHGIGAPQEAVKILSQSVCSVTWY